MWRSFFCLFVSFFSRWEPLVSRVDSDMDGPGPERLHPTMVVYVITHLGRSLRGKLVLTCVREGARKGVGGRDQTKERINGGQIENPH